MELREPSLHDRALAAIAQAQAATEQAVALREQSHELIEEIRAARRLRDATRPRP